MKGPHTYGYGAFHEGDFVVLDPTQDLVFLNADNPISAQRVRHYERALKSNRKVEPVLVIYTKVTPSILTELGTSGLEPLGRRAKPGDWIFVVANGHHRAIAATNLDMAIPAVVILVL